VPAERDEREGVGLFALERSLAARGRDLALFLVYDRPGRVDDRPALSRQFFAQRCVSDAQLNQTIRAFRSVGAYVELFEGEQPFIEALASGRLHALERDLKVVYNGIEGGIGEGGFEPGRKALIPAVADAYGLVCANSNAHGCALGRHKFHYYTVLRALGISTPPVWHYRPREGWAGERAPPPGTKVIAKSTYESWSVGVTDESVFVSDESTRERVAAIAADIGQSVTVQAFVAGPEVCVPILGSAPPLATPPVEVILAKAPGDADAVMTIDDNLEHAAVSYRRFAGPPEVEQELRATSLAAFSILELQAFARIDFRVDARGTAWVTDIGVSPGLSTESSAFASLAEYGFDHPSFLRVVIAATLGSRGLLTSCRARTQPPAS
jgi:D-alanine-D-alanine ligase